jgi:hypothetical protein
MNIEIVTAASSATAPDTTVGNVLVSGSYGGEYNAWHALRKGARAVILNDAGVGRNAAGISGLAWLDRLGVAGAVADCMTCHIGDGEHMLAQGRISHVNRAAGRLGAAVGQTVADCARLLRLAPAFEGDLPPIAGGKRFVISARPEERKVVGLDAAPLMEPADTGVIAVTGSHAALFRGRPDGVVSVDLFAVFFNDAGVGLDAAGIARLAELDGRRMIAATVSAQSAEIGSARSAYAEGIISHCNAAAAGAGIRPGEALREVVARLARL